MDRVIPLFECHRSLARKLPYVSLGEFPTPVQKLDQLGSHLNLDGLFIKRDDLSGNIYGGNKIRKLEFILGDALRTGAKEVLTFGSAGSNHALATAICARQLGLKSISMLVPQPNARYVRRNLLMSYHYGAELHLYSNTRFIRELAAPSVLYQLLRHRLKTGQLPKVIPMGGSSPLGAVGYVNAVYELNKQVLRGEMPEPDYIYVASGSMGTAAGLMLGLRATNSRTRVVAIRVNSESIVNAGRLVNLIRKTNSLLSWLDPSFPRLRFSEEDVDIRHGFLGKRYALFTKEGMEAVALAERYGGIKLEGTYTGKAFAALVDDSKRLGLRDKAILFWNTHNSLDSSEAIETIDYHQLPRCFHRYFEKEVQPLEHEWQVC